MLDTCHYILSDLHLSVDEWSIELITELCGVQWCWCAENHEIAERPIRAKARAYGPSAPRGSLSSFDGIATVSPQGSFPQMFLGGLYFHTITMMPIKNIDQKCDIRGAVADGTVIPPTLAWAWQISVRWSSHLWTGLSLLLLWWPQWSQFSLGFTVY